MGPNTIAKLAEGTVIVATGSVDGIANATAVRRIIGPDKQVEIVFTQAFQVGAIKPETWAPNSKVVLVDLAVNNTDLEMTAAFVKRMQDGGHTIIAVIDEHNAEHWLQVLGSFDDLAIAPCTSTTGVVKSSSALLWLNLMGCTVDQHLADLLWAGEAGDVRDFTTHFGRFINEAVKSAIADNSRRVHMVNWFAFNREPDEKIQAWVGEYLVLLENHRQVLAGKQDLGDSVVRIESGDLKIDMASLLNGLYRQYKVVVIKVSMFDVPSKEYQTLVSIATGDNSKDLVAAVQAAGIKIHGGKGSKVNIAPEDEATALAAVRKLFE